MDSVSDRSTVPRLKTEKAHSALSIKHVNMIPTVFAVFPTDMYRGCAMRDILMP